MNQGLFVTFPIGVGVYFRILEEQLHRFPQPQFLCYRLSHLETGRRFILFIGPISSIFDYITFFIMLYVFIAWNDPALFRTGWFVESLFTQTLIIHVIRTNEIPFIQSWASWPLILTSLIIVSVGAWLTVSPLADTLGFVALPPLYWLLLAVMLVGYAFLTQLVKTWFYRRFGT